MVKTTVSALSRVDKNGWKAKLIPTSNIFYCKIICLKIILLELMLQIGIQYVIFILVLNISICLFDIFYISFKHMYILFSICFEKI